MEQEPQNSAPRRIEAYLDQILAPLTHRLSPFHQGELRRELRAHLWERVDAYRELGQSEADSVTEALRQFGGTDNFVREWHQDWIKTAPQAAFYEIWAAMRYALLLSFPALLITCPGSHIWSQTIFVSQFAWAPDWMRFCGLTEVTSGWASFGLDFIVLPLALGAAVGRFAPRCAGIGVLSALSLELAFSNWVSMQPSGPNLGWFMGKFSWQVFICSVFWLPLACTTAVLTGWWMRRAKVRRRATA